MLMRLKFCCTYDTIIPTSKGLLSYQQIQTAKYTQYDQHINPWKNGDVEVRRQHSKVLSTKLVFIVNL
jgi:hypothetical protein